MSIDDLQCRAHRRLAAGDSLAALDETLDAQPAATPES
jgi:hypothetical protein